MDTRSQHHLYPAEVAPIRCSGVIRAPRVLFTSLVTFRVPCHSLRVLVLQVHTMFRVVVLLVCANIRVPVLVHIIRTVLPMALMVLQLRPPRVVIHHRLPVMELLGMELLCKPTPSQPTLSKQTLSKRLQLLLTRCRPALNLLCSLS